MQRGNILISYKSTTRPTDQISKQISDGFFAKYFLCVNRFSRKLSFAFFSNGKIDFVYGMP